MSISFPAVLILKHSNLLRAATNSNSFNFNALNQTSRRFFNMSPVPSGSRPHDAKKGEKGTPMTPIPSASLIVLCPIAESASSSRSPFSTLVLQRSARQGSSFRSAVVFPGGALDLADDHETGSDPTQTNIEDEKYLEALKLCSLRETFEETGLLLIPSSKNKNGGKDDQSWGLPRCRAVGWKEAGIQREEWAKIREEVHNDASKFVPFLSKVTFKVYPELSKSNSSSSASSPSSSSLPPLASLSHHSNWITPRGVVRPAKRFDAHFFITLLDQMDVLGQIAAPVGQTVSNSTEKEKKDLGLSADGGETTSLRVDTPDRLCHAAMRDQIVLFPPQFYILADLAATVGNATQRTVPPLIFNPAKTGSKPDSQSQSQSPTSTFTSRIVSKIEEEPRELPKGSNYSWDRKDEPVGLVGLDGNSNRPAKSPTSPSSSSAPASSSAEMEIEKTSWVRPPKKTLEKITSIEPKALPNQGTNVEISNLIKRGESGEFISESKSDSMEKGIEKEKEAEDEPFVFPLVLPGDAKASKEQRINAGIDLADEEKENADGDDPNANANANSGSGSGSGGIISLNRVFVSPRTKEEGGGLVVRGAMRRNVGRLCDFRIGICLDELEEKGGRGKL